MSTENPSNHGRCPRCDRTLNASSAITIEGGQSEAQFDVCTGCGAVLLPTLRLASIDDVLTLSLEELTDVYRIRMVVELFLISHLDRTAFLLGAVLGAVAWKQTDADTRRILIAGALTCTTEDDARRALCRAGFSSSAEKLIRVTR